MSVKLTGLIILLLLTENIMAQAASILTKTSFEKIRGWKEQDKKASFHAFIRSCQQMKEDNRAFYKNPEFGGHYGDWQKVCSIAEDLTEKTRTSVITSFFEENFTPLNVHDPERPEGLFTGYFEPVVAGSLTRNPPYIYPLYRRPDDLVTFDKSQEQQTGLRYGRLLDETPVAYFTRKQIEQGLLDGKNLEILWLKDRADTFFIQIQGSGRVELTNGTTIRLAYAGKTGLPYTAIGGVLVDEGELDKASLSMQTIRKWMAKNPHRAQELMWKNKSFVFFRELEVTDQNLGPVGAQHVNLTPETSLAIDRRYWAFGTPVWLDAKILSGNKSTRSDWHSLMIAQDTGSAIRGYARGDVFWGSGEQAGVIAGQMKATGSMTILLPKALAEKLVK